MIGFIKKILGAAFEKVITIALIVAIVLLGISMFRNKATKRALEVCRELPTDTVREITTTIRVDTFYSEINDTVRITYVEHPEPDSAGIRMYKDTTTTQLGSVYSTSFV